ncbi:Hypothetical protein NGAL_HAMBI2605_09590 [Neorhizobium galegae bv. orientalis]|nr:Hypothetical protein NGAL_HAMBI2605_09590 [Neorhizobium galegae bv. orientalis]
MRTPEEHRAAVAAWRVSAPANDSTIFEYPRQSKPRHAKLSDELNALLKWRAMSQEPRSALQTNWRIVPANDNRPEEYREDVQAAEPEPLLIECIHEIRPREHELLRSVKSVSWKGFQHARRGGGGAWDERPTDGDIETRPTMSATFGQLDQVVRLGDLRLGTLPTEEFGSATLPGNNRKIIAWRGRWPVDRFTSAKGAGFDEDKERAHRERLADWLGCEPGWHIVSSKEARQASRARRKRLVGLPNPPLPPISMTIDEAREFAALPIAANDNRPCLPLGSPDVGNIFGGWLTVPKKGKSGSVAADDGGDFDRNLVEASLSKSDIAILDTAIVAQNFAEVGAVLGANGKVAERRGKTALIDAVARLSEVLENIAA